MNVEFLEALEEMAKDEGIERDDLYEAVKKGLKVAYIEQFGPAETLDVEIDRNSGDIRITVDGEVKEIKLTDFGRIPTRKAEETIKQEITRKRREMVFNRYNIKVGELIHGSVHRFEGGNVWINLGQTEALLPEDERIPGERYRQGAQIRAYLYKVEKTQGDPKILVSRAHKDFVAKLLELEVPEIGQGLLKIEKIAREPGVRTKVAVRALSSEIDPVGTCVGAGGSRVKEVVRELGGNEKIDIIRYSMDVRELIKNSLEPAKGLRIELDEQKKEARVLVANDELSLAIGKGGQNVRLTAKLSEYKVEVTSPDEIKKKAEKQAAEKTEPSDSETTPKAEAAPEAQPESRP
ncbi:transcription termination factor NusA [Candidatus Acetothermia bacterium]|nr:transcription termination factor NusA [Candidatus Acetothermia bacterium]